MSSITKTAFDERIVAIYDEEKEARHAKQKLHGALHIEADVISIITPQDDIPSRTLEGNSEVIGKEMISAHFLYSAASFLLGMLVALLLVEFGPSLFANNPLFTFIAFVSPGIFMGIFYAGIRSLKPERDAINQTAMQAKEQKKWSLLIHANKVDIEKDEIIELIKETNFRAVKA